MFLAHRFNAAWRSSLKSGKLTPTASWWFRSCYYHRDVDLQPDKPKGDNQQVIRINNKTRPSCQAVLDHFDHQYSQELGDLWNSVRSVLLDPNTWQYGVMLNRFTAVANITQVLQSQGFSKFLPQADVSELVCESSSQEFTSVYQAAKDQDVSNHHPDSTSKSFTESQPSLSLPHPSLQCYVHPYPVRFPAQAYRPGQLKQYYLLNAASLLPVLALQVRDGEKVLDLCSAPGGKALAIMQSATPALLCCNEPNPHRRDWLAKTLESFLPQSLSSTVIVSPHDGRCFGISEAMTYDKVLVDAPCSNDRGWLYSSSHQQGEQLLKERDKLPVLQTQLLRSALSAVRPGGVVVYSTCTLSSSENYAVVETALSDFPEAEPEDLWEEIAIPLSKHFAFSPAHPDRGQTHQPFLQQQQSNVSFSRSRLGILVVPQLGKAWGPMFLSRIKRKK